MSLLDTASLIVTPNGYKEGKLYSVIPSDGSGDMSVTRATTATRVNSAGLVELVPYNLLGYSQDFTNAYWNKNNGNGGTLPIVTANYATNPFGASNASRIQLQRTSTSGSYSQVFTAVTLQNATQYTWSVWLKSLSGTPTITIAYNGASYSTITLTNEWVRYELPLTTNGSYFEANFGTYQSEASTSLTADFLAWGFQLVEGSTAKDYQKTETRLNIPRLDYSNGTCPSLLVEPQRTNIIPYSSSFDNAAWFKENNGSGSLPSITANYATAPDGTMSADRAQFTNIGGSGSAANYSLVGQSPLTLLATGTATIYLKSNTSSNQNVLMYWGAGQGDVFEVTPEWQRFTLSNLSISSFSSIVIGTRGGSGSFFNGGDEVLDILVWGAQIEAGNYSTSYIPTTSASVTRNADVISKTGISSLIGQTEGTALLDFKFNGQGESIIMDIAANGLVTQNRIILYQPNTTIIQFIVVVNNVSQVSLFSSSYPVGQRLKVAIAYKENDFAFYINGVQIGIDNSGSVPLTNRIDIGNRQDGNFPSPISVNATALWQTRLDNATLAQLTTI
jgi:hypothetical protein